MYSSMTAMIRLPERWQVADALSGDEAFPGDVRQQTDESVVFPMRPVLRVAHGILVAVELQTSRWGVNEFKH